MAGYRHSQRSHPVAHDGPQTPRRPCPALPLRFSRWITSGMAEWRTRNILSTAVFYSGLSLAWEETMNGLIYLIGLIVVILFILSFFGLR
jgi:hypothetical protein